MNVLLFAPGLALLLLRNTGLRGCLEAGALALGVQAALGAPFLARFPRAYLSRAFELSRVFFHTWTVNYKFLAPEVFVGRRLAGALLAGHLATLLALAHWRWTRADGGLLAVAARVGALPQAIARPLMGEAAWARLCARGAQAARGEGPGPRAAPAPAAAPELATTTSGARRRGGGGVRAEAGEARARVRSRSRSRSAPRSAPRGASAARGRAPAPSTGAPPVETPLRPVLFRDSPAFIVYVLLASNFVGIAFARTLHYQFYAWYAQSLPALACWAAGRAPGARRLAALAAALAAVEWAFNVGDAAGAGSPASSLALQAGHAVLLGGLVWGAMPPAEKAH